MPPYTSLFVLALAASVVTPVLSLDEAQPLGKNEERAWSHLDKRESRWDAANFQKAPYLRTGQLVTGILAAGLLGGLTYLGIEHHKNSRDVPGRKKRSFGRGMPVDISEDRSFLDRRTSSHLELLNRADLGEALSLFSRMLDELD